MNRTEALEFEGVDFVSKKYKFGFDIWGMIVFLIIMLPNFIWFAVPAPNDILRTESITVIIDAIGSICQVLMIFSLCVFIKSNEEKVEFHKDNYYGDLLLCDIFCKLGVILLGNNKCSCHSWINDTTMFGIFIFCY